MSKTGQTHSSEVGIWLIFRSWIVSIRCITLIRSFIIPGAHVLSCIFYVLFEFCPSQHFLEPPSSVISHQWECILSSYSFQQFLPVPRRFVSGFKDIFLLEVRWGLGQVRSEFLVWIQQFLQEFFSIARLDKIAHFASYLNEQIVKRQQW